MINAQWRGREAKGRGGRRRKKGKLITGRMRRDEKRSGEKEW